jgi:hypothetical protein
MPNPEIRLPLNAYAIESQRRRLDNQAAASLKPFSLEQAIAQTDRLMALASRREGQGE